MSRLVEIEISDDVAINYNKYFSIINGENPRDCLYDILEDIGNLTSFKLEDYTDDTVILEVPDDISNDEVNDTIIKDLYRSAKLSLTTIQKSIDGIFDTIKGMDCYVLDY